MLRPRTAVSGTGASGPRHVAANDPVRTPPVKRVQRSTGIYEITWSMGAGPAGRATWQYGPVRRPNTPHAIWRRIGTRDILTGL
ncbi:hypothetical protein ACFWVT_35395 [Streptomyces cyaneofuscatus]|uniref:hypothetical protein n=1 Tax=Streptomyces cyaneofuscatus TaxID=66883 RepID=UPI0036650B22